MHLEVNAVEYFYAKGTVSAGMDMAFLYKMTRSLISGDLRAWKIHEDRPRSMYSELSNSDRWTTTTNLIRLLGLEEVNILTRG
ncbi:unnamed protein product [Pylaiella littoralis]